MPETAFHECTDCGYALLSTPPQRGDYWSDSDDVASASAEWRGISQRYFRGALTTLETGTEPGRLLDVGGGPGYFAEVALQRGRIASTLSRFGFPNYASELQVAARLNHPFRRPHELLTGGS